MHMNFVYFETIQPQNGLIRCSCFF